MNYKLSVTSHYWNKDSNLLFDYETKKYLTHNTEVKSTGFLVRKENRPVHKSKFNIGIDDYIANISNKGDNFILFSDEKYEIQEKPIDDKLWIVIKNTYDKSNGYRLREGERIRLGKVMFKVYEMKSDETVNRNINVTICKENSQKSGMQIEKIIIKPKKNENKEKVIQICRICLDGDNDDTNPLINPCNCKGSGRFIHLGCLRKWLNSKITTKTFSFLTVHTFKFFECEICKMVIPEKVNYKNEAVELIEYQKPDKDYIILESLSREKRDSKYLYIINMKDKDTVRLGRSNESDVRMTDISVSRNHAVLRLSEGNFYLEDNNSKFGTLTQLQNDILFLPGKQIAVQSCKLYLVFNLIRTCFAWLKCFENKTLLAMSYNSYFQTKMPSYHSKELKGLKVLSHSFSISESDLTNSLKPMKEIENSLIDNKIYSQLKLELKELRNGLRERHTEEDNEILKVRDSKTVNIYDEQNDKNQTMNAVCSNNRSIIISKDENNSEISLINMANRNSNISRLNQNHARITKSNTSTSVNFTQDFENPKTNENLNRIENKNKKMKTTLEYRQKNTLRNIPIQRNIKMESATTLIENIFSNNSEPKIKREFIAEYDCPEYSDHDLGDDTKTNCVRKKFPSYLEKCSDRHEDIVDNKLSLTVIQKK